MDGINFNSAIGLIQIRSLAFWKAKNVGLIFGILVKHSVCPDIAQ